MSAASHEQSAGEHQTSATHHAALYDADASTTPRRSCPSPQSDFEVCWSSVANPTAEHLRSAEQHKAHAAAHRRASAVLRAAEARSCTGIEPNDRDISPFERVEDIVAAKPFTVTDLRYETVSERVVGAVITFRAVPGLTKEWLQRQIDCHLARNAALGHVVPEMPNCPLVPRGVKATVQSTGTGFAVELRADDSETAQKILDRALRLTKRRD